VPLVQIHTLEALVFSLSIRLNGSFPPNTIDQYHIQFKIDTTRPLHADYLCTQAEHLRELQRVGKQRATLKGTKQGLWT
jgi:hypothetical protein